MSPFAVGVSRYSSNTIQMLRRKGTIDIPWGTPDVPLRFTTKVADCTNLIDLHRLNRPLTSLTFMTFADFFIIQLLHIRQRLCSKGNVRHRLH